MKAILLSIKPEWLAKILNGEKTIEVRKKFPKDYVGWVYLYCSKGNKKDYHLIEVVDNDTNKTEYEYDYYIGSEGYLDWCLDGKVGARFWCDKVEEIKQLMCGNFYHKKICLTTHQLNEYIGSKGGFAIHISKLEVFDRPRELSEFKRYCDIHKNKLSSWTKNKCKNCPHLIDYEGCYINLTKAPQNYCYIEGE